MNHQTGLCLWLSLLFILFYFLLFEEQFLVLCTFINAIFEVKKLNLFIQDTVRQLILDEICNEQLESFTKNQILELLEKKTEKVKQVTNFCLLSTEVFFLP